VLPQINKAYTRKSTERNKLDLSRQSSVNSERTHGDVPYTDINDDPKPEEPATEIKKQPKPSTIDVSNTKQKSQKKTDDGVKLPKLKT
jgi:hypothetical protein